MGFDHIANGILSGVEFNDGIEVITADLDAT